MAMGGAMVAAVGRTVIRAAMGGMFLMVFLFLLFLLITTTKHLCRNGSADSTKTTMSSNLMS